MTDNLCDCGETMSRHLIDAINERCIALHDTRTNRERELDDQLDEMSRLEMEAGFNQEYDR